MATRQGHSRLMKVSVSQAMLKLPQYLRAAEKKDIVITQRGKPVGLLIGVNADKDRDWSDVYIENNPEFARQIAQARKEFREGKGIPLEKVLKRYK